MDTTDINQSAEALRGREGKPSKNHIGQWVLGAPSPQHIPSLPEWAGARGVDGVVWTALPAKFLGVDSNIPKIEQVLDHLRTLVGSKRENAERYIRLAPRQIDTEFRRRIEAELGWTALDKWRDPQP
ncbi:hypothetical protein [Mesorhizobium sp. M0187]|uniref:hypothetical protein n=1 Tax=Mesorhizobium sp. M0187 TaxID=2956908 RepID=UPI00333570B5